MKYCNKIYKNGWIQTTIWSRHLFCEKKIEKILLYAFPSGKSDRNNKPSKESPCHLFLAIKNWWYMLAFFFNYSHFHGLVCEFWDAKSQFHFVIKNHSRWTVVEYGVSWRGVEFRTCARFWNNTKPIFLSIILLISNIDLVQENLNIDDSFDSFL